MYEWGVCYNSPAKAVFQDLSRIKSSITSQCSLNDKKNSLSYAVSVVLESDISTRMTPRFLTRVTLSQDCCDGFGDFLSVSLRWKIFMKPKWQALKSRPLRCDRNQSSAGPDRLIHLSVSPLRYQDRWCQMSDPVSSNTKTETLPLSLFILQSFLTLTNAVSVLWLWWKLEW